MANSIVASSTQYPGHICSADSEKFAEEHDYDVEDADNHAELSTQIGFNILNLLGKRVPYNICRNLEWQGRSRLANIAA